MLTRHQDRRTSGDGAPVETLRLKSNEIGEHNSTYRKYRRTRPSISWPSRRWGEAFVSWARFTWLCCRQAALTTHAGSPRVNRSTRPILLRCTMVNEIRDVLRRIIQPMLQNGSSFSPQHFITDACEDR